ncbi:hypothetical protein [Anaerobacillus arseniciselenatis]|uniref:hypothetical protein n=1 Tax=Anaerobacillus arseniciselenatis TaxID=85682 RepID=UPI0014710F9E|nr:hypothetical protein [Anaerobacillus arseniciselenatis]
MDRQQIDKGLKGLQASLRSSGVEISEVYMDLMREKLSGEINAEQFIRKVRENAKK